MFSWLASLLVHLIIIATTIGGIVALGERALMDDDTSHPNSGVEATIRFVAIGTGLAAFFALKASGLTVFALLKKPIADDEIMVFVLAAVLVPLIMGFLVSAYYIKALRARTDLVVRVFTFLGALFLAEMIDIYVNSWTASGFSLSKYLVPNLSLIAGVGFYTFVRFDSRRQPI